MRRTLIAVTALLCVALAGSAYATTVAPTATNNGYTASFTVSGGAKKDVGVTVTESLASTAPTSFPGGRPYPLDDILTKVSGISSPYVKYFPKCTVAMINNAGNANGWNSVCPKGSQVAVGPLVSALGDSTATDPMLNNPAGILVDPCTLTLHVYNAGVGKLTYFFTVGNGGCGPLLTGAALAYSGTWSLKGGYTVNNVPEDANISFDAGATGDWGSLLTEKLTWGAKVRYHGKTYPFIVSSGCKAKAHSYTASFIATDDTGAASGPTALPPSSTFLPKVAMTGKSKC